MKVYIKIAIIKSLLLLAGFCGYGQSYFETVTDFDSMPGSFGSLVEIRHNYYVTGSNTNWTTNRRELNLAKFDSFGVLIWNIGYGDTLEVYSGQNILSQNDSTVIIFGGHKDSSSANLEIFMASFDTLGNLNWIKFFNNPSKEQEIMNVFIRNDGTYIIVGSRTESSSNYMDVYVLNVDVDGNKIWENWYGYPSINDWGGNGMELPNGDFLVSGSSFSSGNQDKYLIKIDNGGNLLWDTVYEETPFQQISLMAKIHDSYSITINGFEMSSTSHMAQIHGADEQGDFMWRKDYFLDNNVGLTGIYENHDQTFLCKGIGLDDSFNVYGFLMKITPRGDTLWSRQYGNSGSFSNHIYDLIKLNSDSSYVIVGSTTKSDGTNSNGWIKKLDCMGCDSVQCYFPDSCFVYDCRNDYPPVADFTLGQDTFFYKQGDSISIKFENSGYDAAAFTWFFGPPAGQAGTGDSLNLVNPKYTFYQPGDYEITLVARNLECTDTAKATLHILDATGVENSISTSNGLTIFPNPFSQNVRISAPTNGALCIYNELGQMVFQHTIHQNNSLIVEGNELGNNGIYFVILSTSNGGILKEKVVLQR